MEQSSFFKKHFRFLMEQFSFSKEHFRFLMDHFMFFMNYCITALVFGTLSISTMRPPIIPWLFFKHYFLQILADSRVSGQCTSIFGHFHILYHIWTIEHTKYSYEYILYYTILYIHTLKISLRYFLLLINYWFRFVSCRENTLYK